ncbi:MAG: NUDIX hydrolase [Ignavibacteriales bacterium]|nr:NUDIX hydrolase [Ignavibacteriales bacterium]
MNFEVNKSEIIFEGKVFSIQVDKIIYKSGNPGVREIVRHPGGAVIIAVTDENKILLVNQFRYPLNKKIYELPAGKLDKNEKPVNCAKRELIEETGYIAGAIEKIGEIYTSPGFCDEVLHIYLAKNLILGEHKREEGEQGMEIVEADLSEIEMMISDGKITDAKTICGIYYYKNLIIKKNDS